MKKQKQAILECQREFRKAQYKKITQKKPEKVEEVLEDMCVLGSIMKEEIIEEKKIIQKNLYLLKKPLKKKIKISKLFV